MAAGAHREQSVTRAVGVFALTGFLVVTLLGLASVQILRSTGTSEAIDDAQRITELAGRGIVAPAIEPGLQTGDAHARRRISEAVGRYVLGGAVVRVKLWAPDGRILWSDEPRLVGQRYSLGKEEREALEDGSSDAEVSDLSQPENRYERGAGKLLEVYRGIRAPDGQRVLFETYQRSSVIEASGRRRWRRFLPALIGALLTLEIIQIPLAYLLARRLRDRQRERSVLLQRAVDASTAERRAMAAALHDGPVQQLAGVAFTLSATAKRADGDGMRELLDDAASRTRGTMRDLRAMLVDLYPATLHRAGLQAALSDLLASLRDDGVVVTCEVPPDLKLPERLEALLFRGAREAVQNARKHAGARHVSVRVVRKEAQVVLIVADDGRGFDPDSRPEGHMGLALLDDLAHEGGGRLDVDAAPGQGTVVRLEVTG